MIRSHSCKHIKWMARPLCGSSTHQSCLPLAPAPSRALPSRPPRLSDLQLGSSCLFGQNQDARNWYTTMDAPLQGSWSKHSWEPWTLCMQYTPLPQATRDAPVGHPWSPWGTILTAHPVSVQTICRCRWAPVCVPLHWKTGAGWRYYCYFCNVLNLSSFANKNVENLIIF